MLLRYLYVTYLMVDFVATDETTTVADHTIQEVAFTPLKEDNNPNFNSAKCLCGTFPSSQIEGIKTVLTHSPQLEIQCDKEGEMTCKKICTALAEAAKAEGPKLICNKLITGKVLKLYAFYKICGKPWLFLKNVTNWDSFCCQDGKITVCAGEANMGNCSCGAFVTQSPGADDPPLFFQALGMVKCDEEGEVNCRKKCTVAAAENKRSVENLLCTELETTKGLKISAFYKFCEKPWRYQENMTEVVCCTNHQVTDCTYVIHYGNCSCGGFLSQNLIETMAPLMSLDDVSAVTCDEAGEAACFNKCGALVSANKEYAADFLCSKLINTRAMELTAYYKTCDDIWNRIDLMQLVCCANSTVYDCKIEEKVGKCLCGAFLIEKPAEEENPLLSQDDAVMVPCNKAGEKACLKKCKATADLIEDAAGQLCGKLKTVNVSMMLSAFYKVCISPWTYIEHTAEICCVNGSSVVCSSDAEFDRPLQAMPTSQSLQTRRPLHTSLSGRKCTCGAFLTKTSSSSNAPLSQYISVFTNITCDGEGERICQKICTTLAIENEASAANKLCAKLNNVYGLEVLVFYKVCEKSWTYVDITMKVCCEDSKAVDCISGTMRTTISGHVISHTQSVVDQVIDTTKGDQCSCVAFLTREPISDIKPSLTHNIGHKVIECAEERAEFACKSTCATVATKHKTQAINKLCTGLKTYTELELSAFYKICNTSWRYTGITEEFCCEGGQTVVCATGFNTLLSGLENFFGPTAPPLTKVDSVSHNDAQAKTDEAQLKAEPSRGDCSCGAFLSETPIAGELPVLSQDLDPNARCDEQGRTVCVSSCITLATATKFHAVYQLCTEFKTANELKLSAFYKICKKPWTYIDMTETVCCENGKVVPCTSAVTNLKGTCLCGAFKIRKPESVNMPLLLQNIQNVDIKCNKEGDAVCMESCKELAKHNEVNAAQKLCVEMKTAEKVELSALYKVCEKPWALVENMSEQICCIDGEVSKCS